MDRMEKLESTQDEVRKESKSILEEYGNNQKKTGYKSTWREQRSIA